MQAGVAGEVDAVSGGVLSGGNASRDGFMRQLGVVGDTRFPSFPDLPTYKELGYEILGDTWMGVLALPVHRNPSLTSCRQPSNAFF